MSIILVLDDDPVAQMAVKVKLKKRGYQVLTTNCAAEALAYMSADFNPDLLLVDVQMPGANGFDFVGALRDNPDLEDGTPIVFVSDDDSPELCEEAEKLGGYDVLFRPWKTAELIETVEDALADARQQSRKTMKAYC
jgi:CheY-like chemotaxis protein